MLDTNVTKAGIRDLQTRHDALTASLGQDQRSQPMFVAVTLAGGNGRPLIPVFRTIGDFLDSDARSILEIPFMGRAKLKRVYDALGGLPGGDAKGREVHADNATIIISEGAATIIEALHRGCGVDFDLVDGGGYEALVEIRHLAPEVGSDGHDIRHILVGNGDFTTRPAEGCTADMERAVRADKWSGEQDRKVDFADIAMLVRAGLAEAVEGHLNILDPGIAFCMPRVGLPVDYRGADPFEYEPEFDRGQMPAVAVGEASAFALHHLVGGTDRISTTIDDRKITIHVPGWKGWESMPIGMGPADTISRFLTRAHAVDGDCGIAMDGVYVARKDGVVTLGFHPEHPHIFKTVVATLSAGNAAALADHLMLVSNGNTRGATLLHVPVAMTNDLAVDPGSMLHVHE